MRKVLALAGVALVAAVAVAGGAQAGKTARSIALMSATPNNAGIVTVKVKIAGWKMYPALVGKKTLKADGGHWHIFVDGKYNAFSANATTGKTTKLAAGVHSIRVELANNDHSQLKPPVRSSATKVTIETAAAPAPAPPAPAGGGSSGGDDPAAGGGYGY